MSAPWHNSGVFTGMPRVNIVSDPAVPPGVIIKQPQEPSMPEPAVNPKELRAASDGKQPLDYLEPLVNAPVARVMKHGGDKYGYRNYTVTPCKIRTYIGAVQRHLDAIKMGEDIDPDSGESHWAHIIAGSSCYLGCELSGLAIDDRAATATTLSDRVHLDGDLDAKGLTAEYNRGQDELVEELAAAAGGKTFTELAADFRASIPADPDAQQVQPEPVRYCALCAGNRTGTCDGACNEDAS